jgi:predicted nuclease of predicted toxin-antitoxin system
MQHDSLEFWIDVNLPSILAEWIRKEYNLKAKTFRELNFENIKDYEVFRKAAQNPLVVVITTKDYDFVEMTGLPGNLPKVLYLNVGNVTNKQLREIFDKHFAEAIKLLSKTNQQLVEITN